MRPHLVHLHCQSFDSLSQNTCFKIRSLSLRTKGTIRIMGSNGTSWNHEPPLEVARDGRSGMEPWPHFHTPHASSPLQMGGHRALSSIVSVIWALWSRACPHLKLPRRFFENGRGKSRERKWGRDRAREREREGDGKRETRERERGRETERERRGRERLAGQRTIARLWIRWQKWWSVVGYSGEREEDERGFLSLDLVGPLWSIRSL